MAKASNGGGRGKSRGGSVRKSSGGSGNRPNPNGRITGGKPTGTPPKK